jgi:hypothetical protein
MRESCVIVSISFLLMALYVPDELFRPIFRYFTGTLNEWFVDVISANA